MISSKITKRWLRNSFGVIVAIILAIEVFGGIAVKRIYYGQVEAELIGQAEVIATTFQQYSRESAKDFHEQINNYVAAFDQKERMELMIVDGNGQTSITSSGFIPQERAMPDFQAAAMNNTRIGIETGTLGMDQKVIMLSLINPIPAEPSISAIRLVVSLSAVDKKIISLIVSMVTLGVIVLGLVLFSSSYFISSIVKPIGQVGDTARKIAQGDFDARLNIEHDDEIGELSEIINYMAGELGTAERLKNDFISSVSHELRTPLTAIQGWAETMLYDDGQDKELLHKGMNVIIGETQRLSGMVEELLDFSRMQSGRLKLIKAPINPITELNEAVLMYTQKAEREKIKLDYTVPKQEVMVYGDNNRLRQVFINIIDNAVKYSDPGDTVTITVKYTEQNVCIYISDTGIGISQEDLPQITAKFYKADSTRRGSGIGLAVAEEIVIRHDGTLTVDSVKDEGTTIAITLPIYKGNQHNTVVEDTVYPPK